MRYGLEQNLRLLSFSWTTAFIKGAFGNLLSTTFLHARGGRGSVLARYKKIAKCSCERFVATARHRRNTSVRLLVNVVIRILKRVLGSTKLYISNLVQYIFPLLNSHILLSQSSRPNDHLKRSFYNYPALIKPLECVKEPLTAKNHWFSRFVDFLAAYPNDNLTQVLPQLLERYKLTFL